MLNRLSSLKIRKNLSSCTPIFCTISGSKVTVQTTKKSIREQLTKMGAKVPDGLDVDNLIREANQKYGNNLDIDDLLKSNGVELPAGVTFSASSHNQQTSDSSGNF